MVGFEKFREDPEWITAMLYPSMTKKEVIHCLKILQSLKMIRKNAMGRWERTKKSLVIPHLKGKGIFNYHRSVIDLAMESARWDINERSDIFCITFSTDRSRINEVRDRLLRLLQSLFQDESHVVEPDQIYQVNFQIFSLFKQQSNQEDKILE